jgi:hypothetical protein
LKKVPLPNPEIGLVVHYAYLFHNRTRNIGDAGKDRPCLIVAVFPDKEEPLRTGVLYLPITHSEPSLEEEAIEIPADVKAAAGLDGLQQWLLVSQANLDTWPEDIFHRPSKPGIFHYGFVPPGFFKTVQTTFARLYVQKTLRIVPRNSPA